MMMWTAFAGAWDDIIDDLRSSDIICDKEVGPNHTNNIVRSIKLSC
jgi:hypothetical protein